MAWFNTWFNSLYFQLYAHRTLSEARGQVESLFRLIPEIKKGPCLDLACGNARHLLALAERSEFAAGVELSPAAVEEAKKNLLQRHSRAQLVRADFRALPFSSDTFVLQTNFFTSFGYLEDDAAHAALLREWRRTIKIDGVLFLDFLNRDYVLANLEKESLHKVNGLTVRERRSFHAQSNRLEKIINVERAGKITDSYLESVRLFSASELMELLNKNGFQVKNTWGDFSGKEFQPNSPRLLVRADAVNFS